jgi:ferritin
MITYMNINEEAEKAINSQINMELYVRNVYQSMTFHYDLNDDALPDFSIFFRPTRRKSKKTLSSSNT